MGRLSWSCESLEFPPQTLRLLIAPEAGSFHCCPTPWVGRHFPCPREYASTENKETMLLLDRNLAGGPESIGSSGDGFFLASRVRRGGRSQSFPVSLLVSECDYAARVAYP